MATKKISRRKLIKDAAKASLAGALYFSMPGNLLAKGTNKSRVVLVRDQAVLDADGVVDGTVVRDMLDRAVVSLTEAGDAASAWKQIVKPDDVVGIKTNVWQFLATPPELEQALKERVLQVGVKEDDISINDRGVLRDPVFKRATALINVRPMRTHNWAGVGTCIKNYIMFTPKPSSYHPDSCADLATLFQLPEVKGKSRLHILVMFTPLFHGIGPHHFNKAYTWPYKGMIVGFDPVAVDATGLRILTEHRKEYFGEDRPLNPPAKHIELADTRHHLGNADAGRIEVVIR